MSKTRFGLGISIVFLLAACSSPGNEAVGPTNTLTVTLNSLSTIVTPPAENPTASMPMIEIDGLQVPDPHVSNPELFDITKPDSPIVEFANAFGVTPQEVGELTPELKTAADGSQFVVLTTSDLPSTANFDESGTPLVM